MTEPTTRPDDDCIRDTAWIMASNAEWRRGNGDRSAYREYWGIVGALGWALGEVWYCRTAEVIRHAA